MIPPQPKSTLFPYTTLFRSLAAIYPNKKGIKYEINEFSTRFETGKYFLCSRNKSILCDSLTYYHSLPFVPPIAPDRKSTRLNSSHVRISYAVFCLKKKKQNN